MKSHRNFPIIFMKTRGSGVHCCRQTERKKRAGNSSEAARPPPCLVTPSAMTGTTPEFVEKLLEIVHDERAADCVRLGEATGTVLITDVSKFTKEVLPRYFQHDRFRTFTRHCSDHGFQRCSSRNGSTDQVLELYCKYFHSEQRRVRSSSSLDVGDPPSRPICGSATREPTRKRRHESASSTVVTGSSSVMAAAQLTRQLSGVEDEIDAMNSRARQSAPPCQRPASAGRHAE